MASHGTTSNQRPTSVVCALLVVLLGACGNNATNEKVDAGQRRYCSSSTDAGLDLANREAGQGGDTTGVGPIDTASDSTVPPDLLSDRIVAETRFDDVAVAPTLDSGPLDLGGGGDSAGDSADSKDSRGPDADSGVDAKDAPIVLTQDTADAILADVPTDNLLPDLADAPDVADAPGEPGPEVPLIGIDAAPDVSDVSSPGVCFNNSNSQAWAQRWDLTRAGLASAGLAAGTDGTLWTTGVYNEDFDFNNPSGPSLSYVVSDPTTDPLGKYHVFVAKLDPSTGLASAAFGFTENAGNVDHTSLGISVASGSNVGVIGIFKGEIDFDANNSDGSGLSGNPGTAGLDYLQSASAIPFYGVFDGSGTPDAYGAITPKKVHMVDVGTGVLLSIASNPAVNAIAVCGKTTKVVPNYSSSGATKGVITGGTATYGGGNSDIIVFKVDASTGAVIWGKQYGGAGDQVCESVAMDSSGNVFIGGNYSGELFSLPSVADTTGATEVLFLAELYAADGTLASAVSWGGSGVSHAFGLTVDGANNIVMAGGLNTAIDFGNSTGPTAWTGNGGGGGLDDVFVVKFNSAMVAQWAKADGDAGFDQNAKSVATDSSGNVILGGTFKGTLPNLFHLTAAGNSATDAFAAKLSASDGSLLSAHVYGDALGDQALTVVSVAPTGTLADAIFVGGKFGGTINLGTTMLVSPGVQACTLAVDGGIDGGSGDCTCVCGFCANPTRVSPFISRLAP